MAQTFNTILSFVKSTSRKDRRKGVGSLSVSAVAGGGVGSVADSATQSWVRNNFVDKTTEQEISAPKIFSQGIKIGDVAFYKHADGYVYLDETLVLKGGVVMYGNSSGVDVPSIFDSLPIDGRTIKRDGNGALYVDETALSISGGGGVADSVHWNNVIGKPSWIGSAKPTYKYSEIEERPDLSVYAKTTDIPSLAGYATQSWVENKGYLLATTASSIYQPKITSSNKLAYSLISGTPDLSVYALNTDLAKKWTQNDAKIANWDSAYSWGNHANAGYAKASAVTNEFKNYVKLAGDAQSITAQHNFINGLKIGGISLRKVDNYLYLDSSLVLSGGVTMYGDDGTTVKPIWESIPLDESTLAWSNGKLSVIGGVGSGGGISEEFLNVKLQDYQPKITTTNKLAYSLISGTPDLSVYAKTSGIPTKLSQLTDDVVAGNYLPLSGGTINGSITATSFIGNLTGNADSASKIKPQHLSNFDSATANRFFYSDFQSSNSPGDANYFTGLTLANERFSSTYKAQLAISHTGRLHTRYITASWSGWSTLAFTSDIPTKLSQLTDDVVAGKYLPLSGGTINGSITATSFIGNLTGNVTGNVSGSSGSCTGNAASATTIRINNASSNVLCPLIFVSNTTAGNKDLFVSTGKSLTFNPSTGGLSAKNFIGNLTGNADSATKLATARTIWGQSFDGTGNITGNIAFATGQKISWHNYPNAYYISSPTTETAARLEYNSYGGHTFLGGNVAIGGTTADAKLHVHGTAKFTDDTTFSSKVVIGTIPVYQSADGTLFVDANVVFRGGVAMYGDTSTTVN